MVKMMIAAAEQHHSEPPESGEDTTGSNEFTGKKMSVMISRRQERSTVRVPSGPTAPKPATLPQTLLPTARAAVARREQRKQDGVLTVGRGIEIKGGIQSCAKLVVEGKVEASLDAQELVVAEEGCFTGCAEVEEAEISGTFDGDLTVRGLLKIKTGGRISGTIRYAEITVQSGGRLAGDVDVLPPIVGAMEQPAEAAGAH